MPSPERVAPEPVRAGLVLGALGVVFGDIGTSPLYTLQECLASQHGVAPEPANVFGVVSLVCWAVTLVVTVKYLAFLMRADNHGAGGIMALLALVPDRLRPRAPGRIGGIAVLVIVGAALLFGDGIITPAISVLSAVEGLAVAAPGLEPAVVPVTLVIPRRPVRGPASRHGPPGCLLRPDHDRLVPGHRRAGREPHPAPPGDPRRAVAAPRPPVPRAPRLGRPQGPRATASSTRPT